MKVFLFLDRLCNPIVYPILRRSHDKWISLLCSIIVIVGIVPDLSRHMTVTTIESFLNFEHYFMGGSFFLAFLLMLLKSRADKDPAVMKKYKWMLMLMPFVFLSFLLDGVGHQLVGKIEIDLDIISSPTHIFMTSMIAGVLAGSVAGEWNDKQTVTITVTAVIKAALFTLFMLIFFNLLSGLFHFVAVEFEMIVGVIPGNEPLLLSNARTIIPTSIIFMVYMMMIKRWKLFPGTGTIFSLVSIGLLIALRAPALENFGSLLPVALITGVALDLFYLLLKPGQSTLRTVLFSAIIPIILWGSYIFIVSTIYEVVWSPYFITAFPVLPAMFNVMLGVAILTKAE